MRIAQSDVEDRNGPPRVVVAGAGAAGTLTALHLVRSAVRRATSLEVLLLDPGDRWGRGVAFGTPAEEHLLNVPASGMSALPEKPGHFVAWASAQGWGPETDIRGDGRDPNAFLPRRSFGLYLDETLSRELVAADGRVMVRHLRDQVTGVLRTASGWAARARSGRVVDTDALVVATGLPQVGCSWVPRSLRESAFFIADPWAPGALDVVRRDQVGPAEVLVVGAGLTMVDVVLSLAGAGNRADRRITAISRSGRLPRAHQVTPALPAVPDITDWGSDLQCIIERTRRHLREVRSTTGDWRPGVDGLRFRLSELWGRLDDTDRARFLAEHAGAWNVLRHRMAPASKVLLDSLRSTGRLQTTAAEVLDAEPMARGGLRVSLSDGSQREVGWVVNCTGPRPDVRDLGNPLIDDLLRTRPGGPLATIATAGMGFCTDDGRVVDSSSASTAPIWTLGALRRGELWESTAVPEIRGQAAALATSVLDTISPLPRQLEDGRLVGGHHPVARPRDPLGLPLSTTAEAAESYNAGLERVMGLQSGAEELISHAVELDPDFAVAHAALAMLGHEAGAAVDVQRCLAAAREAIRRRGDAREASLVDVVGRRVEDVRGTGARALMAHIATHPRDVLAVSAAVPTIAFSGVTDIQREAWNLVEGLAPAYGDHWWYISLLAFTRQDQARWDEAGMLAESALSCQPASGHAVHAQTHVLYETGQHEAGRVWLDHWVAESGRSSSHRAHFSWHAALHELALGETEALRRRYYSQLAPPAVTGVRALVDSASLLWRWQLTTSGWDDAAGLSAANPAFGGEQQPPPVGPVLGSVDEMLLLRPQTPFMALHAAVALAAAGDTERLGMLRHHCAVSRPVMQSVVAPLCDALVAGLRGNPRLAATLLGDLMPELVRVGGSAAQREVVEEAWLYFLVNAGEAEEAARLLEDRLERRPSPLDARRRAAVARTNPVDPSRPSIMSSPT